MPNANNIIDGRPHRQDDQVGYELLNQLEANDEELLALGQVLQNQDGSPGQRCFARLTGNYLFTGGVYALQRQAPFTPYLPASITPAAHIITMTFVSALPESTYDVQLTPAKAGPSSYATIQYDMATKSASQLVIYPFVNGLAADLDGFSVEIKFG